MIPPLLCNEDSIKLKTDGVGTASRLIPKTVPWRDGAAERTQQPRATTHLSYLVWPVPLSGPWDFNFVMYHR